MTAPFSQQRSQKMRRKVAAEQNLLVKEGYTPFTAHQAPRPLSRMPSLSTSTATWCSTPTKPDKMLSSVPPSEVLCWEDWRELFQPNPLDTNQDAKEGCCSLPL